MIFKSIRGNVWDVSDVLANENYTNVYLLKNSNDKIIKIASIDDGPLFCEINFYIRYCKPEMVKDINILNYIDSGVDKHKNFRFLVLPKIDCNLKQIVINDISKLSKEIILALKYVHNTNHIHSDIKPENILYDKDKDKFYLSDFGTITRHTKDFESNPLLINNGTYEYISIDMHNGIASYKSDLESFGYMLYDILYALPWNNKPKRNIIKIKETFINDIITSKNKLSKYFAYIDKINNDTNIDYDKLIKTLI